MDRTYGIGWETHLQPQEASALAVERRQMGEIAWKQQDHFQDPPYQPSQLGPGELRFHHTRYTVDRAVFAFSEPRKTAIHLASAADEALQDTFMLSIEAAALLDNDALRSRIPMDLNTYKVLFSRSQAQAALFVIHTALPLLVAAPGSSALPLSVLIAHTKQRLGSGRRLWSQVMASRVVIIIDTVAVANAALKKLKREVRKATSLYQELYREGGPLVLKQTLDLAEEAGRLLQDYPSSSAELVRQANGEWRPLIRRQYKTSLKFDINKHRMTQVGRLIADDPLGIEWATRVAQKLLSSSRILQKTAQKEVQKWHDTGGHGSSSLGHQARQKKLAREMRAVQIDFIVNAAAHALIRGERLALDAHVAATMPAIEHERSMKFLEEQVERTLAEERHRAMLEDAKSWLNAHETKGRSSAASYQQPIRRGGIASQLFGAGNSPGFGPVGAGPRQHGGRY